LEDCCCNVRQSMNGCASLDCWNIRTPLRGKLRLRIAATRQPLGDYVFHICGEIRRRQSDPGGRRLRDGQTPNLHDERGERL
jgi:hypothetical protein